MVMSAAAPHRYRVMFVDDSADFLQLVREVMTDLSGGTWEILCFESTARAFARLQEQPADLVVVDIEMEVMDGIQFLSLLSRGHPQIPKVTLTGSPSEARRAACLANGAELFLQKPTRPEGWQQVYFALNELLRFQPEPGFRGVLRRVGLEDVLQMECLARNSSVLEVAGGAVQGEIFVEDGQIIHAQVDALQGEAAFNRLLAIAGGRFNLRPFVEPPARTIAGQWEFLLMEAARQRDEAKQTAPEEAAAPAPELPSAPPLTAPPPDFAPTPAPAAPPVPPAMVERPDITEMLVCSSHGEVLHEWQCPQRPNWVTFFEFLSHQTPPLAHALSLGEFDRLAIETATACSTVLISTAGGALITARKPAGASSRASQAAASTRETLAAWLRQAPTLPGELFRAVRLPNETFLYDNDTAPYPPPAIAQSWRRIADAWDVLTAHQVRPESLTWSYQQATLLSARRTDGTLLGVVLSLPGREALPAAAAWLDEFRSL